MVKFTNFAVVLIGMDRFGSSAVVFIWTVWLEGSVGVLIGMVRC